MTITSASDARAHLFALVRQVNDDADTVTITSKAGNAVLVSEAEWSSIQETMFVMSQPGYDSLRARAAQVRAGDLSGFTERELVHPPVVDSATR